MSLDRPDLEGFAEAFEHLNQGFRRLPPGVEPSAPASAYTPTLLALAERLKDNYPYHHPNYAGQMLKPPHPLAQSAYALAQQLNPNNHALDGGRATSALEKEAVAHIASMFGLPTTALGHLTSGGTVANLEALWVARETLPPGVRIVSSEFSHYTHHRLSAVLGVPHTSIAVDRAGRMDLTALRSELQKGDVGLVVATLGTTAYGSIDPLAELVALRREFSFRLHVDAAYGGYFSLLKDHRAARHFDAIAECDSVVVDPHKHGLQPYGCGCILFANPDDGAVYAHDSPYTYFTSDELHLGEISLECSRAGASAAALWATQQALPNVPEGDFANSLARCVLAAERLSGYLQDSSYWSLLMEPELDVVVWVAPRQSFTATNEVSQRVFDTLAEQDIHIALVSIPKPFAEKRFPTLDADAQTLTGLRVCLMKPEHLKWVDFFSRALDAVATTLDSA